MAKKVFTDESLKTLIDETKSYVDNAVSDKSDSNHNHDSKYDAKGSASTVQTNLDSHVSNTSLHFTTAEKTKLSGIESGAQKNTITGVKGNSESSYRTGNVNITKANIGLGNVDNTSDANKPVSTAQQTAIDTSLTSAKSYTDTKIANLINGAPTTLDTLGEIATAMAENEDVVEALESAIGNKVDKVSGKGLSTNDLTSTLKTNYDTAYSHVSNKSNPHGVTLSQLGVNATAAELNYVDGVTSSIQTQLDGKAASGHNHDDRYYTETEVNTKLETLNDTIENTYMAKSNPSGTGSLSLNRKSGTTVGRYSFAIGSNTEASGWNTYAEGEDTKSTGNSSHAEGKETESSGFFSHAEGWGSIASGDSSHAEGTDTKAIGGNSHAEGDGTEASDLNAHAEGYLSVASGYTSHAEGMATVAAGEYQHAQGKYNIEDTDDTYAHIVGNGDSNSNRSNAHTIDWYGNANFAGDVYVGNADENKAGKKLATEEYVDTSISELDTIIATDENSDGNIVLRQYIPEEDFIQVDKTLSIEGAAADAKAVGDRLQNLNVDMATIEVSDPNDDGNVVLTQLGGELIDDYLTAEEANTMFAPSGYGWGEGKPHASIDANTANTTCVFVSAVNTPTIEHTWLCEFYATSNDGSGNWGHMVATCQDEGMEGCVCTRLKRNGVWTPWEWENPPMTLGTEYRTTERWHGYPVYRKIIIFGELPNNTYKSVTYHDGAWGTVVPVSATGRTSGGKIFPTNNYSGSSGVISLKVDNNTITIYTNLDLSAQTGYVDVRYIYL